MSISIRAVYVCDSCDDHTEVWTDGDRWCGRDYLDRVVYLEPIMQVPPIPPGWVHYSDSYFCPKHDVSIKKAVNLGIVEVDKDG